MTYLERTTIDRDLVLEFFLVLSRFEFAIKAIGYVSGDEESVNPDWNRFGRDIGLAFNGRKSEALEIACALYLGHPPKKQILKKQNLDWATALPNYPSGLQNLLVLVRRVRNNLFHGGKYNSQFHDETARNNELLRAGLLILQEALILAPDLKSAYDEAAT